MTSAHQQPATDVPFITSSLPTDVPFVTSSLPTDVPFVTSSLPTDVPFTCPLLCPSSHLAWHDHFWLGMAAGLQCKPSVAASTVVWGGM